MKTEFLVVVPIWGNDANDGGYFDNAEEAITRANYLGSNEFSPGRYVRVVKIETREDGEWECTRTTLVHEVNPD